MVDLNTIATITEVAQKPAPKGGFRYGISTEEQGRFSTFNKELGETAINLSGKQVMIDYYESDGKARDGSTITYKNITNIQPNKPGDMKETAQQALDQVKTNVPESTEALKSVPKPRNRDKCTFTYGNAANVYGTIYAALVNKGVLDTLPSSTNAAEWIKNCGDILEHGITLDYPRVADVPNPVEEIDLGSDIPF